MRRNNRFQFLIFILTVSLAAAAVHSEDGFLMTAEATTASEIEEDIRQHQSEYDQANDQISALEAEQDLVQEKMEDLKSEIINTMASIGVKEDEIAAKEEEIAAKQDEIRVKQAQIEATAAEYEKAKEQEEQQRLDMAARTKLLYEEGDETYLGAFLQGSGLSELLNRMDYIEKIYEYSKMKLDGYMEAKEQLQDLWNLLEQEKAQLQADEEQLQVDKADLETQKEDLASQKSALDVMLAQQKRVSDNYDAEIDRARQAAAVAMTLLKQDRERLNALSTQTKPSTNASSGNYTSDYDSVIDQASGSDLGKKIARYACQYIGNPYVSGGTSLTNGADCSGFTYRVYQDFGYTLPRTSTQQRSAGTGVSYDEAQVGDLICYEGHVALYIGGGLVVHASNSSPYPRGGIKVNKAQYRTILAVRRII